MMSIMLKALLFYAFFVIVRYAFWGYKIYKSLSKHKKDAKRTSTKKNNNVVEVNYKVIKEEK